MKLTKVRVRIRDIANNPVLSSMRKCWRIFLKVKVTGNVLLFAVVLLVDFFGFLWDSLGIGCPIVQGPLGFSNPE